MAYSLDLRKRVLRAWDSGMDAERVAAKYEVSRAWVHRLVQRRREAGSIEPRKQTRFRGRVLSPQQEARLGALMTARSSRRKSPGPPMPLPSSAAPHNFHRIVTVAPSWRHVSLVTMGAA